jgi:hypothetical protein
MNQMILSLFTMIDTRFCAHLAQDLAKFVRFGAKNTSFESCTVEGTHSVCPVQTTSVNLPEIITLKGRYVYISENSALIFRTYEFKKIIGTVIHGYVSHMPTLSLTGGSTDIVREHTNSSFNICSHTEE